MKLAFLFFLAAAAACPQRFSFGAKIGHPIEDVVNSETRLGALLTPSSGRYTIGPTVELMLPYRLSLEFDILYRPVRYAVTETRGSALPDVSGSEWRFPLLAKYRVRSGLVTPYVAGGPVWQKITGFNTTDGFSVRGATGAVAAAGLEGKFLLIHLSGELRYTRWGSASVRSLVSDLDRSKLNQAELLVGVTF